MICPVRCGICNATTPHRPPPRHHFSGPQPCGLFNYCQSAVSCSMPLHFDGADGWNMPMHAWYTRSTNLLHRRIMIRANLLQVWMIGLDLHQCRGTVHANLLLRAFCKSTHSIII